MQKSKKTSKNEKKQSSVKKINSIRYGEGKFDFPNGDRYEGTYVVVDKREIFKQDYGTYKTSDGDSYIAKWDKDRIVSKIHIIYDNKAEYEGEVDENGAMNGIGIYKFPDGSAFCANWQDNKPTTEQVFIDLLGHRWFGKFDENRQEIVFSPENCIWDFDAYN